MRTVYVQELMRLPLGKQGENGAARIVWQGLAARYQALYGSGAFTLTAKRCGDAAAYPVAVSTEGGDVVWLVRAADVASPGSGSCELTYTVDGAVAKSQTWSTYVAASISGDAPGEPPEEPAKAWFAAIQAQIGNLDDLTTKARASLVAAVNEAAKTGSGGGVDIDLGMTGAAAGQVAKVKAVDADGKPTAWEPADLPGGGDENWELLANITTNEDTKDIDVTENIAGHKKFYIVLSTVTKGACQIWIAGNDKIASAWVLASLPYSGAGQKSMITKIEDSVDGRIIGSTNYSSSTNGAEQNVPSKDMNLWMGAATLIYSADPKLLGYTSVSAISKLKIFANTGTNPLKAGTWVRIYGVKA